jgi:hypothetical protein
MAQTAKPENKQATKPPSGPAQQAAPQLSSAECVGLGGKVSSTLNSGFGGACGQMCTTVDNNGVVHNRCIDEQNK